MQNKMPLVLSITSGKGGVGKTNLAVNLAVCLTKAGKRVVLVDADLGLANVDVLLGLTPEKNIFHLFTEGAPLEQILFPTPYGFSILPASSGVGDMHSLDTGQKLELLETMDSLENEVDYLIVDTGAGINDSVLYFNLAVQERILVLTPEPTSLTDAYSLIKIMQVDHGVDSFKILVNQADNQKAALDVFARLHKACDHFLAGVSLDLVGYIPRDPAVRKAVLSQTPYCIMDKECPAAVAVQELADNIQTWEVAASLDGNIKFFWKKLLFR